MTDTTYTYRILGSLALIAAVVLVGPAPASAEVSHEVLWGGGPTSCVHYGAVEHKGLVSFIDESAPSVEPASQTSSAAVIEETVTEAAGLTSTPPCFDLSTDGEKSNNVCFEKAGVPASVVPKLLAKARALEQSQRLVALAEQLIDREKLGEDRRVEGPKSLPLADLPPAGPNPQQSCTGQPDTCRGLPPLPPELTLEASGPSARQAAIAIPMPDRPEPAEQAAITQQRIAPSDGYDSPPDKPPRR